MGSTSHVAAFHSVSGLHNQLLLLPAGLETPNYNSPAPKSLGGRSSQRPSPAEGQDISRPGSALKGSKVSPRRLLHRKALILRLSNSGSSTVHPPLLSCTRPRQALP